MKFKNVSISAMSYHLPEMKISSEEIEEKLTPIYNKLKLPSGRLELMTGIKERRYWEKGTKPSDLSTEAAANLFKDNNKLKESDIDLLIHSSVCRDFLEPSTASIIHNNLKLKNETIFFDLSNACLGVVSSIIVAANMIEMGTIKHALIVSGENGGPLLFQTIEHLLNDDSITRKNIKKHIASLTIGSAAVAITLSRTDLISSGHKIIGSSSMSDTEANILCQGDGNTNSLMMETDSEKLMEHGITLAKKNWEKTKEELSWGNNDVDFFIGHQVGIAHETLTNEALGLNSKKSFVTYPTLGNTGSAALPITLMQADNKKLIQKNQKIALLGIGSGLNSIMLGVEW